MKPMRSLPVFLLALAALAVAVPQAGTLLRRSLAADAVDTYKVEERVKQTVKSPLGELPVEVQSSKTLVVKTLKVDAASGTAGIETTTTVDKMTADGPIGDKLGPRPAPVTQKGKIDVRGRTTYEKTAAVDLSALLAGASAAGSGGNFIELPEKAVEIGATWDIVVPKGPYLNDADQKLVAKLVGEKVVEGVPVWVVTVTGTIRSAVDSSKMPGSKEAPATAMRAVSEVDLTGEGWVEKSTGRTFSMVSKGVLRAKIELVETGIVMEATGTIDSTLKLQKPGA